jgi:hypothetical protein
MAMAAKKKTLEGNLLQVPAGRHQLQVLATARTPAVVQTFLEALVPAAKLCYW